VDSCPRRRPVAPARRSDRRHRLRVLLLHGRSPLHPPPTMAHWPTRSSAAGRRPNVECGCSSTSLKRPRLRSTHRL